MNLLSLHSRYSDYTIQGAGADWTDHLAAVMTARAVDRELVGLIPRSQPVQAKHFVSAPAPWLV